MGVANNSTTTIDTTLASVGVLSPLYAHKPCRFKNVKVRHTFDSLILNKMLSKTFCGKRTGRHGWSVQLTTLLGRSTVIVLQHESVANDALVKTTKKIHNEIKSHDKMKGGQSLFPHMKAQKSVNNCPCFRLFRSLCRFMRN